VDCVVSVGVAAPAVVGPAAAAAAAAVGAAAAFPKLRVTPSKQLWNLVWYIMLGVTTALDTLGSQSVGV
jgi:hypothetical protein